MKKRDRFLLLCYNGHAVDSFQQEGGERVDTIVTFLVSVAASVVSYFMLWSSVFVTLVAKKYRFMQFELDRVFDTR